MADLSKITVEIEVKVSKAFRELINKYNIGELPCWKCNGSGVLPRALLKNPDFDGMAAYLDNDNVEYCCDECDGRGQHGLYRQM
jgi:hypothetical protein